jgi:RNA polymerase sigma factor for flagellar operon FliA
LEPQELLTANLPVIESAVAFACRRYRLDADETEELAATVRLRLVENDYAVLRAYEQRCAFRTYISIVVQRIVLDYRIHAWGKWHASTEARRLGPMAVELEQLLRRDGRSLEEATLILGPKYSDATPAALQSLAAKLPRRAPRHREVPLEEAVAVASPAIESVEERSLAHDRRRVSDRVSAIVTSMIEQLPEQDRLILHLRFSEGMRVSDIARALQLDQKLLYRRIEQRGLEMRKAIESAGIGAGDALDLVGREGIDLEFRLRNSKARPSMAFGETAAGDSEASR